MLLGIFDIAISLLCVCAIPIVGKRIIMLIGLAGVVVFCFGIAANAYFYLDFDISSFRMQPSLFGETKNNPYALALFIGLTVCASLSGGIPWVMNGEVYPFR